MAGRSDLVRVALVGGPMYDALYATLPEFERATGLRVDVVARLPHPELNAFVKQAFESGDADLDLLSTHTKYAPSQARWLAPLDADFDGVDLLPRAAELSRLDGKLLQVPRNLDVRLLHYRRDLIEQPPATWQELAEVASALTQPGRYGFLFPGRDSGLFGTFYEMLVGAGGELFDESLRPAFDSPPGVSAAAAIADLHHVRRVTPRALPDWHYDEISASFRAGDAAMVCDWPGSHHLYRNPATCAVWDRVGLAPLPAGAFGLNAAYGGCHSFAIAATARNAEGAAALLRFLTSPAAQLAEARQGAIPCRASALTRIREDASADPDAAHRWRLLAEAQRTMIVPPRFGSYPSCEDVIWRSIQRAMVGEWSSSEAVRSACSAIQLLVAAPAAARS
jgi:multiple sugar transport system substrate-binding protein